MTIIKKSISVILSLLLVLTAFPITTQAADVEVSTFGQLQTAVSNASGNTNIIVAANITFTEEVTIPSGKNITITSSKSNNFILITVEGCRHFGVEDSALLTLENITIDGTTDGGYTGIGDYRGGIYNNGELALKDGTVVMRCYNHIGGGIFNDYDGEVTVINSIINDNIAYTGGGLFNLGTANIEGSKISCNESIDGGGIVNLGMLSIERGEITDNNVLDGGGGGILSEEGEVNLDGVIISGNTAGNGAGVLNAFHSTMTIKDGKISGNEAYNGGGIINLGMLSIEKGEIIDNIALDGGGGISNWEGIIYLEDSIIRDNKANIGSGIFNDGEMTINGGKISGNEAFYGGGGVVNYGALNIEGGEIFDNVAIEGFGGGILGDRGEVNISGTKISSNTAGAGGGIFNCDESIVIANGGKISANKAFSGGGGGVTNQGVLNIEGWEIINNTVVEGFGGGVLNDKGEVNFYGVEIRGNTAGAGGGIFNYNDSVVIVNGGKISSNKAFNGGGGVANYGTLNIKGGEIIDNVAVEGFGGGVLNDRGEVNLGGTKISGNTADAGGGIFNDGVLAINSEEIIGNIARYGGGIANTGILDIDSSKIISNDADYGGGINNFGTLLVKRSLISDNYTIYDGGGIWADDLREVTISDTIFNGNTAAQAYWMNDIDDIVLHNAQITGAMQFSDSPAGQKPFKYAYNNYDLSYTEGLTENPLGVSVSGRIISYNPNNPITIQLIDHDGSAVYTEIIDAERDYSRIEQDFCFKGIEPGSYSLVIKKAAHTKFTVQNVVVGNENVDLTKDNRPEVRVMTLRCGDISSDGLINDADLTILWRAGNYNKKATEADDPLCDLNGDGLINDADLTILWLAYNYNRGAIVIKQRRTGMR